MKSRYIITTMILILFQGLIINAMPQDKNAAKIAYQEAYNLVLDEKWDHSIDALEKVIQSHPRSQWVDDARFWQCYAREKTGRDLEQIFDCYQTFLEQFEDSKWSDDAKANLIRVGEKLAKSGKSEYTAMIEGMKEEEDQEIAIAALMAMQNMGDAEVIPIISKLYSTTRNSEVKEKVIFILSQSDAPEAENQLITIAKTDDDTEMREQAVFWIGQNSDSEAGFQTLKTIVLNDPDEDVREKAVFALSQMPDNKGMPVVIELAQTSEDSEVRENAVFWIGQNANSKEHIAILKKIVDTDPNEDVREKAVFALAQSEHGMPYVIEIAETHKNSEMREKAIFWIGQNAKPQEALRILKKCVMEDPEQEVREQAVFALGQIRDNLGLDTIIDIAKTHKDPEMREKAVFWISQSSDSEKSLNALKHIMKNDKNQEVREQTIFAVSQLPEKVGIPVLIDIAKNDPSSEIRKKAIFWLGQSSDPRAKETLLEIIEGGE
ncbi:HEAT repeat domain-containing protein [candidate division KSB1 bacterium]|nr:HEAT repeat domain-containing protein [candidate division KSB1 bacterium]